MDATVSRGCNQVPGKLSGLAQMVGAVGAIQLTGDRATSGSWARKSISTMTADIAFHVEQTAFSYLHTLWVLSDVCRSYGLCFQAATHNC